MSWKNYKGNQYIKSLKDLKKNQFVKRMNQYKFSKKLCNGQNNKVFQQDFLKIADYIYENSKNRRKFIKDISKLTLFVLLNQILFSKKIFANNRPKVVVIGLGFGGATCVKYLSNFSRILDLVVIEKNEKIQTCPFSNLVIGDIMNYSSITFDPNIKFNNSNVRYIDSEKKRFF